jgi:hypothetical protein
MRRRVFLLVLALCLTISFSVMAGSLGAMQYPTKYLYHDLFSSGSLPGVSIEITAINDAKQIVGYYSELVGGNYVYQAFFWDPVAGYALLKPFVGGTNSYAYAINQKGQIVGKVQSGTVGPYMACLWSNPTDPATRLYWLNSIESSCAYGINDAGTIVGEMVFGFSTSNHHAARWDKPGEMPADLGTLGYDTSLAKSINNSGQVAGVVAQFACIWEPGQQVAQKLSTSLDACNSMFKIVINSLGNVVGTTYSSFGLGKAFYWNYQTKAVVPNIGTQLYDCWAFGLSDTDQAVGSGEKMGGFPNIPPFVFWNPTKGTQNLNQMVVNLPPGVTITDVSAISPKGAYIIGSASNGNVVLLTPLMTSPGINLMLLLE